MDVFTALADPTRRRIVEMVSAGEMSAGQIADNFAVSRPGVSRHLRVLRESGLLTSRVVAQSRIYRVNPRALDELDDWTARARAFWSGHLSKLDALLEENG
jgi:DNA-binding transcriptional ArsR family regulator